MAAEKIRLVVATRAKREDFAKTTATGRTLAYLGAGGLELQLFAENSRGLPDVYNQAIDAARDDPAILVFCHDDLLITDFYWQSRLMNGLAQFDVIGLAGNTRRLPRQASWARAGATGPLDFPHISGLVGHGNGFPAPNLSRYGAPRKKVLLMDGLFLAVRSTTLHRTGLRFDPRFDFHFYDLDFCREAEVRGVTMGTWDISVIHASGGRMGTDGWQRNYDAYLAKWGE